MNRNMDQEYRLAPVNVSSERTGETEVRLQGDWLRGAQIVWLFVAALAILLFVVGIPTVFALTQSICGVNACSSGTQLTVDQARTLEMHGISLARYAVYSTIVALSQHSPGFQWVG